MDTHNLSPEGKTKGTKIIFKPRMGRRIALVAVICVLIVGVGLFGYLHNKKAGKQLPISKFNQDIAAQINAGKSYDQVSGSIKNADQAKQVGEFYVSHLKYDDAVKALLRAIELKPDDPEIFSLLASAYDREGKKVEAKTSYQKAAEIYKKQGNKTAEENTRLRLQELDSEVKSVQNYE